MGRIILIALGAFILYKLVFNLIIPAVRITGKMRRQMKDFHNKMQEEQQNQGFQQQQANEKAASDKIGEYIDYEEIR